MVKWLTVEFGEPLSKPTVVVYAEIKKAEGMPDHTEGHRLQRASWKTGLSVFTQRGPNLRMTSGTAAC